MLGSGRISARGVVGRVALLQAHPGATVRACLDSRCVTSAQDSGILQLVIPSVSYPPRKDQYTLTVTSANAAELHRSTTVRLEEAQVPGPFAPHNESLNRVQYKQFEVLKTTILVFGVPSGRCSGP